MLRKTQWMGCALVILFVACSEQPGGDRKLVSPVTGEVLVDGKPVAGVQLQLHDTKGPDTSLPTISQALTDDQGKFSVSTYDQADGAPPGDYTATFFWGDLNLLKGEYGPDKLKKKYSDKAKSTFKVKVEEGKTTDMGRIELTTK